MSWFVVDVESDGPIPSKFSLVSFGAVRVDRALSETFFGQTAPISEQWDPAALAISNITRETHATYPDPKSTMERFAAWLSSVNRGGRPTFVSDNPAFDFAWINFYFHFFVGKNPFGHSARRIGDLWAGMQRDTSAQWKHLRKTAHTHHPVDDAKGNAEALLAMADQGLALPL